jgi:hypothetical protein
MHPNVAVYNGETMLRLRVKGGRLSAGRHS